MYWETRLSGGQLKRVRWCVYGWFRGDECLYIGQSKNGLRRILTHDIVGVVEELLTEDEVRITYVEDRQASLKLERELIRKFQPKHNLKKWSLPRKRLSKVKPLSPLRKLYQDMMLERSLREFEQFKVVTFQTVSPFPAAGDNQPSAGTT